MKNNSLRTGDYITDVLMRTEADIIIIIMLQVEQNILPFCIPCD